MKQIAIFKSIDYFRVDAQIHNQYTPGIFWHQGNSYVLAHPPEPFNQKFMKYEGWLTQNGTPVLLCSINGIGEVRWRVSHLDAASHDDAKAVVAHFKLTPYKP